MIMKKKTILISLVLMLFSTLTACDYLDIVPDNVATIEDNAFALRSDAKRFLYTCYSYIPSHGDRKSTV